MNKDTQVNVFFDGTTLIHIQDRSILSLIHAAATVLGKDFPGFAPKKLGLHSIQSGGAMAMYLKGVLAFTIMLLGHWSSDAFLIILPPIHPATDARVQLGRFDQDHRPPPFLYHLRFSSGIEDPHVSGNAYNLSARTQNGPHASSPTMPRFALHA
jgi:hypothetical protein